MTWVWRGVRSWPKAGLGMHHCERLVDGALPGAGPSAAGRTTSRCPARGATAMIPLRIHIGPLVSCH